MQQLSIPLPLSTFDSKDYLLNCPNGTLDMRTGQFREHRSEDYITQLAGVSYDPAATSPRWEQFMREITCGDEQLARFIQKALGYALTGDTRYECFFLLYGATTRNGKGTLCETFMRLMGTMAVLQTRKALQPGTIMIPAHQARILHGWPESVLQTFLSRPKRWC